MSEGGTNVGNVALSHSDSAVARRFADVAVQPRMGLLPERHLRGSAAADRVSALGWLYLTGFEVWVPAAGI